MNSHTQHNKLQKILTKDFLQREYVENQKLMQTIANDAKCGKATICRYLQEFGIKARIISVTRKRQCKRKICLDCGKLLGINSNYHDTKHCNSCAHKGKLSSTYIDGRCLKNYYCSDCGKQISATCAIYGKGDCSSCAHKGKNNPNYGGTFHGIPKMNKTGKDNPNYKDGRTSLIRGIYMSNLYKKWRKLVYERDDYTGQKCKFKKKHLEAHHTNRFVEIYEEFVSCYNLDPNKDKELLLNLSKYWNDFWDIKKGIK